MIESQGFTANLQIPFSEIPQFSDFDKWYAYPENQKLLLFENPPNLEGIANALKARKEYQIDRNLLADTVAEQYQSLKIDGKSNEIDSLRAENTFAITCAHQPNVFTGPVFFIYKLLSTIKLAEQCNQHFPEAKFVPILYLGSEDHDVAEINHIHLFGKRIEWPTSGTGAVGRIPCTELEDVKEEIYKILGDSVHADELKALIDSCYSPDNTLAEAITLFLHHLLPQYPFLIFNPDDEKIKSHFIDIIEADILKSESYPLVMEGQEQMAGYGLKTQAYVRPINFFYLGPNFRERIEYLDGKYHVLNRDITFTIDEIKAEIKGHPERFSPNVILRPLLQDLILPTIAFVGGGGELAYWADRRLLFKHFNIPFPVLIRRDSVLVLDQTLFQLGATLAAQYTNKFMNDKLSFKSGLTLFSNYLKEPQNIDLDWSTETAFMIWKGINVTLNTRLFYDHDIPVQITDANAVGGVNGLGRRVSFTEQLYLKYNYIF